jgi:thioredoxin reductase (NADPH)
VRPDIENRIKEGSVAARFNACVTEITPTTVVINQHGTREELPADAVFLLTGYHPDVDLMRKAGIHCDDVTLAPELNMETFETNVPNLFIAGGAIAGKKTGNIFIENGRFHGDKIIQVLVGRLHID